MPAQREAERFVDTRDKILQGFPAWRCRQCPSESPDHGEGGRANQCLVDNAVPLRKAQQIGNFPLGCVRVQAEAQANILEADWDLLRHPERSAKVEVTLGLDRRIAHLDSECGG